MDNKRSIINRVASSTYNGWAVWQGESIPGTPATTLLITGIQRFVQNQEEAFFLPAYMSKRPPNKAENWEIKGRRHMPRPNCNTAVFIHLHETKSHAADKTCQQPHLEDTMHDDCRTRRNDCSHLMCKAHIVRHARPNNAGPVATSRLSVVITEHMLRSPSGPQNAFKHLSCHTPRQRMLT